MFRRCSITLGWLFALNLIIGCGPVLRSKWKVDRALDKVETAMKPNKLDTRVYLPSHRVALATLDVLKVELAEFKIVKVELTRDKHFDTADGKTPEPDSVVIPGDYSACWLVGSSISKTPILVNCHLVAFEGKTRDGQKVNVQVRIEVVASDQRTVESVQVGGRGDDTDTQLLIAKISERLKNPTTRPGSLEERAALKAMFDLGASADIKVSEATGEITIATH